MRSRIFKSGNSLAVRIPKELAFEADVREVHIEREGDRLIIRPASRRSLAGLAEVLASFPGSFMAEGRGLNEQASRAWGR